MKVDRRKELEYLNNKEKVIRWQIVAGPPEARLSPIQTYDVVFDEKDLKLRQMVIIPRTVL